VVVGRVRRAVHHAEPVREIAHVIPRQCPVLVRRPRAVQIPRGCRGKTGARRVLVGRDDAVAESQPGRVGGVCLSGRACVAVQQHRGGALAILEIFVIYHRGCQRDAWRARDRDRRHRGPRHRSPRHRSRRNGGRHGGHGHAELRSRECEYGQQHTCGHHRDSPREAEPDGRRCPAHPRPECHRNLRHTGRIRRN
jgi:hypothetical protein